MLAPQSAQGQLFLFRDHHKLRLDNLYSGRPAKAQISKICEAQMIRAAKFYDIPLSILYAVGLSETAKEAILQPFALNIKGRTIFAKNLNEALDYFHQAQKNGVKLIDIGCMQINYYYHGKHFRSVEEMFEPRANVFYAAHFLKQLYLREKSWSMAVARYHAGAKNYPAQQRYICRVIANLVASGFGSWTDEAAELCFIKK